MLGSALNPASVAIVGASDNPHKVGGRPILYLKRYGYRGAIYPINPARSTVQGLRAYPSVRDTPEAPELAIVAIAGEEAVGAVEACAARGVKVAVVMTSGFGETGAAGLAKQKQMVEAARRAEALAEAREAAEASDRCRATRCRVPTRTYRFQRVASESQHLQQFFRAIQ